MVLERVSSLNLSEIEAALRRAARRHRAGISLAEPPGTGIAFNLHQQELYDTLLAADMRFSALVPCRIAAYPESGHVVLVAQSPVAFCRTLKRHDVENLAAAVETLLTEVFEEASKPATLAAAGEPAPHWGATEDQVNMRLALPQRIDNRGSKVEDLAGTGEHDSPGG